MECSLNYCISNNKHCIWENTFGRKLTFAFIYNLSNVPRMQGTDCPIYPGHFSGVALKSLKGRGSVPFGTKNRPAYSLLWNSWILKFIVPLSCNTTYCTCLLYHPDQTWSGRRSTTDMRRLAAHFVSDLGVLCLLPTSKKQKQANLLACNQISDPRDTLVWSSLSLWSWLYIINQNSRQRNLTYSRNLFLTI